VFLIVTYESLRLAARVIDEDSTPEQNDVVEVGAVIGNQHQGLFDMPMLDDGSLTNVSDIFDQVQVCYEDPIPGVCTCRLTNPPTFSGDVVTGDGIYTREPFLSFPPIEAALGCMIEVTPRRPLLNFPAGTSVSVTLRATDRIGNVSYSSTSVTPAGASVFCAGDACGCCLLVNTENPQQCSGLEGMPSPDFPGGICRAF
jgi:hypothetical protein